MYNCIKLEELAPYEKIEKIEEIEKGCFDVALVAYTNFENMIELADADCDGVSIFLDEEEFEKIDGYIKYCINEFVDTY